MSSSGMIGSTTPLPSFNQLVDQFKDAKADKHIRFGDGKEFYTSQKASLTNVKAFLGSKEALQARDSKRQDGLTKIMAVIEQDYGKGVADLVMRNVFKGATASGVTKRDLDSMQAVIGTHLADVQREQDNLAAAQREKDSLSAVKDFIVQNIQTQSGANPLDVVKLEDVTQRFMRLADADKSKALDADILGRKASELHYAVSAALHDHYRAANDRELANEAVGQIVSRYIDDAGKGGNILGTFLRTDNPVSRLLKGMLAEPIKPAIEAFVASNLKVVTETPFRVRLADLHTLASNTPPDPNYVATRDAAVENLNAVMGAFIGTNPDEAKTKIAQMDPEAVAILRTAAKTAHDKGAQELGLTPDKAKQLAYKAIQDLLALRTLNPAVTVASGTFKEGSSERASLVDMTKLTQSVLNLTTGADKDIKDKTINAAQAAWHPQVEAFYDAILASA